MRKIKITHGESVEDLREEIAKLEQKCKDLEESRQNTLESCRNTLKEQKKKIAQLEKASEQINNMCNSVMKYLAHVNEGILRVPKNHLEITKEWGFICIPHGDDYVFEVKGDK